MLAEVEKHKPDVVVQLGDWLDASAVTTHPNEDHHTQAEEYNEVAIQAMAIRGVCGRKTDFFHLDGNHEARLTESRMQVPRRIRDLVHWKNHPTLGPEWSKWRHLPYIKGTRGVLQLGQVLFYHGWSLGTNSEELEAIQIAQMAGGGSPGLLCIRGHSHMPVPPTQTRRTSAIRLPWWYANAGHLGPESPTYTWEMATDRWGHGLIVGECLLGGRGQSWDATLLKREVDRGRMDLGVARARARTGANR